MSFISYSSEEFSIEVNKKMSTATIDQLNNATLQVNRYGYAATLLFGMIGNVLSIIVLSQRTLRSNPCAMYFLAATTANIISLISGMLPPMLSNLNILSDGTETIQGLCKTRIFVLFTSRSIASWLLVFATIDRYLVSSTNANTRRMSNTKQARRSIIIISIISLLFWTESIYCFDANLIGTPLKCYARSDVCRIFNDLAQAFVTTLIPSSVMLVFGLYTIANIRQTRQVQPTTMNNIVIRRTRTDHSLTRMLLVQVIFLTIFNIPLAIQKFYLTATFRQSKSLFQITLEKLLFNIVILFTFIPNCIPFYLYILTSQLFRKTLVQLVRTVVLRLKCT